MSLTRRPYEPVRLTDLSGGQNDSLNETLLKPNQTPEALNCEFNRRTVQSSKGMLKLNNQNAPRSAIRTRVDKSFSPLYVETGMGVPCRGYVYIPWAAEHDIGGDAAEDP